MRLTKQKKMLQEALQRCTAFFNAEELHENVRSKGLGIATTYRFLKKKAEQGELHSFLCGGKTIYSTNKNNHCHFTCEQCGAVHHIPVRKLDFLPERWKVCHVQIDITGVCERCQK